MKLFKRTLSVLLAVLMIFSSFSVLSSAVLNDGNENTVKITTKYYREVDGEWVETNKIAEGDKVKARVFIETDYAAGGSEYFFFYPQDFFELDMTAYEEVGENQYDLLTNPEHPFVVNDNYAGWFTLGTTSTDTEMVEYLVLDGYVDESEFDKYDWIYIIHDTGKAARIYDGEDWFFEFDFIAKKGATGNGFLFINEGSFQTPERDYSVGYVSRQPNGDGGSFNRRVEQGFDAEFDYDLETPVYDFETTYNANGVEDANGTYVMTVDGKLINAAEVVDGDTTQKDIEAKKVVTTNATLTFDAGEGEFADGSTKAEATGKIKSAVAASDIPAAPEASNKVFAGWVPASIENPTKADIVDFTGATYGYEDLEYKAFYESASGSYVVNTYVMDTEGNYGEFVQTTPPATVGTDVSYDTSKIPAGFTLDTSKENVLSTKVTSDDTDVMTVYLKRNKYAVTFGETSTDVYYEADYSAPVAPAKEGYAFTGWKAADGSVLLEGAEATMGLEAVAYTATYTPAANTATIVINYVDQVTGETKKVEMEVPTTTENTIAIVEEVPAEPAANTTYVTYADLTAVTHYEFTAEGSTLTATVAADGSTVLNVNYVPVEYTATFTGAVENETITKPYYSEITAPAAPAVAGQTFEGWTVNGTDIAVKAGETVKLEGDVIYTAKYSVDNYTITYVYADPAPAGVSVPAQVTDAVMGTPVDLSFAPEADGWTFDGWTVSGAVEDGDGYVVGTAPVTVTGKWIKNTYTVNYWLDEAKTVKYTSFENLSFGDTVEIPAEPEVIDLEDLGIYGKDFDFWVEDEVEAVDEGTVDYFDLVSKGVYVYNIVAELIDLEYEVNFYFMGVDGYSNTEPVSTEYFFYGDAITADYLPDVESVEGYTFNYWKIDGSQAQITDWVDYEVTAPVKVRAYFTINTYNAIFNAGEGAWLDADNNPTIKTFTIPVEYGAEITAPTSNPVLEGHYLDPEMPWGTELGYMDIEDVYFEADWYVEEYTVNWVSEGATVRTDADVEYGTALTAPTVSKPGYKVEGWYDGNGVAAPATMNDIGANGATVTYTAKLVPDENGVDYKVNIYLMNTDGSYSSAPTRTETEHDVADTDVTYSKTIDGFALDTTKGKLTGKVAGDGSLVLDAYYARNKIAVNINGKEEEHYQGSEIDLPVAPEKEGETFEKWVDENGNEVTDPYVVPNEEDKSVTITPVYTKNTYEATFIIAAEGVSNTYTTTEAKYESPVVVPAVPTEVALPAGYTFVGWAKTADATEALDDLGAMPVNGVTFYAVLAGKTAINYNIEKYFMGTDGVTYTLDVAKSETKADGTAGAEKTITPDTYEGFTFDADNAENVLTAMIKGDGSTTFKVYYDRNTVKVTINGEEENKFFGEEIQTPENVPENEIPEGNKQDGWVDGDGNPVTFPVKVGTDPIVIEPNFVPDDFVMTFVNGDETVQSGNQTFGKPLAVPADQVLAGYTFDGWFDAAGNKVVTGTTTVPSTATTYTAKFTANSYNVTFVAQGATVATGDYAFGTKISTIVPAYTAPAGFTFEGWSTDGSTVVEFTDDVTVPVNGVTYYAVLKANSGVKYTIKTYLQNVGGAGYAPQADEVAYGTTGEEITYVPATMEGFTLDEAQSKLVIESLAGDGSSVIRVFYSRNTVKVTIDGKEDTYYYGEEITEPERPTPEDGYEQPEVNGWKDQNGDYVNFPITVPAEDLVINPVYVPIKYAVTFNVDGKEYATGKYDFDTVIVAPEENPAKTGYTFEGWSVDGKTVLADLGKVAVGGNTFEAVFTANSGIEYTVNKVFQNVDGSDWEAPVAETRTGTAGETVAINAADEKVEGFAVYQIDPASTEIAGDGSTVINIYYTRNKVSVTINGKEDDYYFGETITEPTDTAKPGYDFIGWVDGEGDTVTFPVTVPAEDLVITPVYEAQTKSLSFVVDGVVVEGYPTTAKVDSTIVAPADPYKEGYKFLGWYAQGSGVPFNGKMPATDVVYEASFTAGDHTQYTIEVYMMDTDGKYTMSTATISHGVTGATATIIPGATAGFTYDASLSELSKKIEPDGSTVLKIYYARDLYTVTWNVDGTETTDEIYFGAAIVAPADPEKTGYTFAGWDPAVAATMPANDVVYSATWAAAEYTLTYVVNGTKDTETYKYGETVTVKDAPAYEGMRFEGWFDGTTEYVVGSTFEMPAEDLIIVADYVVDVYKVTFLAADGSVYDTKMVKYGDAIVVPTTQPTKEFYVFTGWDLHYTTMPAEDIVVAPIFERVPVKLIPMSGSTTVIDRDNMIIYGLEEYLNENILLNKYLDVEGDGYIVITPIKPYYYGTGAKVELYDNLTGEVVETFTIIVFGDLNGDSLVQAIDGTYAGDENLMLTTWSQQQIFDAETMTMVENPDYDFYKTFAADLNKDGVIDSVDATIISDSSIGILIIDQVTGRPA